VSVVGPAPAALIGRVVSCTLAAPPELPSPTRGRQSFDPADLSPANTRFCRK
jgi:hypothetical protein